MEFYVSMLHPLELWALFRFKYLGGRNIISPQLSAGERGSPDLVTCYRYLEQTSRSFAGVIRSIRDESLRPAVAVFYLVLRALDTLEDDSTIPRDEKAALLCRFPALLLEEGWSYPRSQGRDRIVLQDFPTIARAYRALPDRYRRVISETAGQMGTGFTEFLETPILSLGDWDRYCLYAAGLVGVGLTRLFRSGTVAEGAQWTEEDWELSVGMGRFLQKTNITRDYLEDTREGRHFWPREVWSLYGDSLDTLGDPRNVAQGLACLNHLITLTLAEAPKVLDYLSQLSATTRDTTLFNFCAIPQVMAIATLLLCYDNRNVFSGVVKIRRGETVSLMQEATSLEGVKAIFRRYSLQLRGRVRKQDPSYRDTLLACDRIADKCGGAQGTHLVPRGPLGLAIVIALSLLGYRYRVHSILLSGIQAVVRK